MGGYGDILDMHRWLAIASVTVYVLRAIDVLMRTGWLSGRGKVLAFVIDLPLTVSGLSLWGLAMFNPFTNALWLLAKLLLLAAYVALGAWALRAQSREAELLALLLALVCMGLLWVVSSTRSLVLF
jgi:uncharacterized membrane protein SirB2